MPFEKFTSPTVTTPSAGAAGKEAVNAEWVRDLLTLAGVIAPVDYRIASSVAAGEYLSLMPKGPQVLAAPPAVGKAYVYPYELRRSIRVARFSTRVQAGGANCAMKFFILAHDQATRGPKPSQLALAVDNVGVSIAITPAGFVESAADIPTITTIAPQRIWVGVLFGDSGGTATIPQTRSLSGAFNWLDDELPGAGPAQVMGSATNLNAIGLEATLAYSTDLTTFNWSGLTWTRVQTNGGGPTVLNIRMAA